MDSLRNIDSNTVIAVVVTVLALYVLYRCFFTENFAQVKGEQLQVRPVPEATPTEMDETQREIVINPPYNNPDTRTIMAGSGFIPQKDIIPAWGNNYGLTDDLDDGEGGNMGMHYNLCSPSCCSAQYPTPHKLEKDPLVCGREDEFLPTPYTCNNAWQNSGCVCATKKQVNFLTNRGGNAN